MPVAHSVLSPMRVNNRQKDTLSPCHIAQLENHMEVFKMTTCQINHSKETRTFALPQNFRRGCKNNDLLKQLIINFF